MSTLPRTKLLAWYDRAARDLPWRRTRDPYAIWVSEIMLQQTRVDTVIPYYERFLDAFPTPHALAAAPEEEVLSLWSGLGYYRRARLLHAGVREVVTRYGGDVPRDAAARRALPGIGRYTAGAIGSIAFDLPEPIVDGNVARVLSRHDAIGAPLGSKPSDVALWQRAEALARGPRPGTLNQALMELGATVCSPVAPRCGDCPLARTCVARKTSRQDELPVVRPKKSPVPTAWTAVLARTEDDRLWLVRRPGRLLGGLWMLPTAVGHGLDAARGALADAGIEARLDPQPSAQVVHVLTHRRLVVELWLAHRARAALQEGRRSIRDAELARLATATLLHKLLATQRQAPLGRRRTRRTKSRSAAASRTSPTARTRKSNDESARGS